jgi:hypothetical protein
VVQRQGDQRAHAPYAGTLTGINRGYFVACPPLRDASTVALMPFDFDRIRHGKAAHVLYYYTTKNSKR